MSGRRKALFIAANYWNTPYRVGSHEIASLFAANNWEVGFLSDPVSPFHLFLINNYQVKERFKIWIKGGFRDSAADVWTYIPLTLFPPQKYLFLKSKFVYENWHRFTIPDVYSKLKKNGFNDIDLLYFDNATQGIWLNKIKHRKSVFRVADNYSGYEKYAGYAKTMQKKLAKNVDLVLYTARNFESYIEEINPSRALYFPNGVNFDRFANGTRIEPEDLKHIPHPRIIYVGEMEIRFDFDLIKTASRALPDYSFILIGNDAIARGEFQQFSNVYTLGTKKSNELPGYLYNCDVGIIPFNVKKLGDLINYVNPLKLHQYFACGLPVVSAKWSELERMNTKAFLYDSPEEFIQLLGKAVNSNINKNELIESAKSNDWKLRYYDLINELGF